MTSLLGPSMSFWFEAGGPRTCFHSWALLSSTLPFQPTYRCGQHSARPQEAASFTDAGKTKKIQSSGGQPRHFITWLDNGMEFDLGRKNEPKTHKNTATRQTLTILQSPTHSLPPPSPYLDGLDDGGFLSRSNSLSLAISTGLIVCFSGSSAHPKQMRKMVMP